MYTVTGRTAGFNAGARLKLTPEQASSRAHKLSAIDAKKGLYEATGPIEFKTGETVGFDGELPKTMVDLLDAGGAKKASPVEKKAGPAATKGGVINTLLGKGNKGKAQAEGPAEGDVTGEEADPAEGDKAA